MSETQRSTNERKGMIVEDRVHEITGVGCIAGGDLFDVFAVSYGDNESIVRIRFEQTGDKMVCNLPPGVSLAEELRRIASAISKLLPGQPNLEPTLYQGRRARKLVKRIIVRAKAAEGDRFEIQEDGFCLAFRSFPVQ